MMLGIHGNGLTHEMWMPEDGTLIEVSNFIFKSNEVADRVDVPTRNVLARLSVSSTSSKPSILRRSMSALHVVDGADGRLTILYY